MKRFYNTESKLIFWMLLSLVMSLWVLHYIPEMINSFNDIVVILGFASMFLVILLEIWFLRVIVRQANKICKF